MARKKEYSTEVVVEKAMQLFWINGYKTTSMQMLEQEMGINKFSIYASFGNKQCLFIQSLKCYKRSISNTLNTLKKASNGTEAIKQFFYDSVNFNSIGHNTKGCFVTNTYNEFSESEDEIIRAQMTSFMNALKLIIIEKLRTDKSQHPIFFEFIVLERNNILKEY
jgi:AcrR family transcriptional regulator